MLKKGLILLFAACMFWPLVAGGGQAATVSRSLSVGGLVRTYTVYLPAVYDGKTALPVVIMLHGAGATGDGIIRETGWDRKAEEAGFLAVFPDAARPNPASEASFLANPQLWNDGSGRGLAFLQTVDDVKFLGLMVADLAKNYATDRQAVFLAGFSSGASLTFKAAEELPGLFAAIAPVAGPYWPTATPAPPRKLAPTLFIAGLADPFNPSAGGIIRLPWGSFRQPPLTATINGWAARNGCPAPQTAAGPSGTAVLTCADGRHKLQFILVEGLGHLWPGGEPIFPESYIGSDPGHLNATDTIWAFFAASRPAKR